MIYAIGRGENDSLSACERWAVKTFVHHFISVAERDADLNGRLRKVAPRDRFSNDK